MTIRGELTISQDDASRNSDNLAKVRAMTSASILVKIIDLAGSQVEVEKLLTMIYEAHKNYGIHLYDFYHEDDGKITSQEFWEDLAQIISSGYAKDHHSTLGVTLTERGKEFSDWLYVDESLLTNLKKITATR